MNGDESLNGQGVVPLRTILRNFLNLVETYEARRNGGADSYDSEFQELKQFSESLKGDPDYMCKEGEKSVNRSKNRYKDILPFDYTRVILSDYGDVPGSDYINANFIKGASGSSAYIASQGPLPHTVNDFWRMVVECEVQVIVMACNEQESGKHKCENYWVEEDTKEREFGEVIVWLKKSRQVCPDFLVRTMRIRFTNARGEKEERNVCQFHYSAWPDHGVPTKVRPLLDMVRLIRDRQTSETLPVLVHCSAGCGRTGTICAIDYVWGLLRLGRLTQDFSLFTLVREMRKQRIAMVQTKDQYILVHRAVKELFQEQLKIIDSHPYANVDANGLPFDLKKELQEPTYEVLDFAKSMMSNGVGGTCPRLNNYHEMTTSLNNNNNNSSSNNNNNNNNNITVSVSNVNVRAKALTSGGPKTSLPSSSSSSCGETGSSATAAAAATPPAKEKTDVKIRDEDTSGGPKVGRPAKPGGKKSVDVGGGTSDSETNRVLLDKKNSSGSESEVPKSSSNIRSALLRKPSIVKLKSFFERSPTNKDEKKPGQLSRAKSDVSTRFYNFTAFRSSNNNSGGGGGSSAEDGSKANGADMSKATGEGKEPPAPKKPPILTKPTIPIKRSKSFKIPADSTQLSSVNHVNHHSKSRKKSEDVTSNPSSSAGSSSNPSTSSTFSSNISDSPIKVCVKQVEIPKLQAVVSKSIKAEAQMAKTTTTHEYDYDIDDRSHLRQKPISPSALQREGLHKSSKNNAESNEKMSSSLVVVATTRSSSSSSSSTSTEPKTLLLSNTTASSAGFNKPVPPSRIHILKDGRHNYANVGFDKGNPKTRRLREMEDIQGSSSGGPSGDHKYGKLMKKCDTVNPRILAASMGLAPKHERTSLTRSQSHVWQAESSKTQIPIRIFSDENLHQSSSPTTHPDRPRDNQSGHHDRNERSNGELPNSKPNSHHPHNNNHLHQPRASSAAGGVATTTTTTDNGSEIFIQAILPEVKSMTSDEYRSERQDGGSSPVTPSSNSKPVQRRRVPKTNPYANYPACITGSNTNFPYKQLSQPADDLESFPIINHTEASRAGLNIMPSLRPSHPGGGSGGGGGGSVGNSSDSSSNTATPRNSSPGTPTQSVDVVYPKLFRSNNRSSNPSITQHHPQSGSGDVGSGSGSGSSSSSTSRSASNIFASQPKSILKEPIPSSPSESDDKLMDTLRGFPPSTGAGGPSLPKINTIRIAVGVRERRNSFRQAVWKEAHPPPASPGISAEQFSNSDNHYHQSTDLARSSTNCASIPGGISNYASIPQKQQQQQLPPPPQHDPPKIHKNYEPIWPDPNSCNNGNGSGPVQATNLYSATAAAAAVDRKGSTAVPDSPDGSGSRGGGKPLMNPFSNHTLQTNSSLFRSPAAVSGKSDVESAAFQTKVDEIKVMLAQLQAAPTPGDSHNSDGGGSSGVPALKQQRSLRASSRSHYQQGLSCFAFRKPSSYESIVDQLQTEDSPTFRPPPSKSGHMNGHAERGGSGSKAGEPQLLGLGRLGNDYVALGQCRTADSGGGANKMVTNGFTQGTSSTTGPNRGSSSPEFPTKLSSCGSSQQQQQQHHHHRSPSTTPVPPPRTRKNHFNPTNDPHLCGDRGDGGNVTGFWPASNYMSGERMTTSANSNPGGPGRSSEPLDEFSSSSSEINQNDPKSSSTSPKAIIRALGLFQAKAANVRSRLANWAETRERAGGTKRMLENGMGAPSSADGPAMMAEEEPPPSHSRFQEPLNTFVQPSAGSQLTSTGLLQRSKHQYL